MAIYYSPTSFEARSEIVGNAVIQIASEQKALSELLPIWTKISEKVDRARRLRNAVAHGSPITHLTKRWKMHVRWSPPAFDVIRIGRKRSEGQLPGISERDIAQGRIQLFHLERCIEAINRLVREWQEGNPSLQKKFDELQAGLAALNNRGS